MSYFLIILVSLTCPMSGPTSGVPALKLGTAGLNVVCNHTLHYFSHNHLLFFPFVGLLMSFLSVLRMWCILWRQLWLYVMWCDVCVGSACGWSHASTERPSGHTRAYGVIIAAKINNNNCSVWVIQRAVWRRCVWLLHLLPYIWSPCTYCVCVYNLVKHSSDSVQTLTRT